MKVLAALICLALAMPLHAQITKPKSSGSVEKVGKVNLRLDNLTPIDQEEEPSLPLFQNRRTAPKLDISGLISLAETLKVAEQSEEEDLK